MKQKHRLYFSQKKWTRKTLSFENISIGIDTGAELLGKGIDCGKQVSVVNLIIGLLQRLIQGIQSTMRFGACLRLQNAPDKVVEGIKVWKSRSLLIEIREIMLASCLTALCLWTGASSCWKHHYLFPKCILAQGRTLFFSMYMFPLIFMFLGTTISGVFRLAVIPAKTIKVFG